MRIRRPPNTWTCTAAASFETVLHGEPVEIQFNRRTSWEHDRSYGSDADGNRGIPVTFKGDDEAVTESIRIIDDDGHERIPTTAERAEVETLIATYMDTHEPEPGEDEREPDPEGE